MVNKPLIRPHFLGVNVALGGVPSVPMKISVDGSEIWRENQFRLVDYPIIYDGFYTSQVVSRISERSTVAFRMFDNMGLFVLWRELFPSIKSIIFISHLESDLPPQKCQYQIHHIRVIWVLEYHHLEGYLEDHPRTRKWLIAMIDGSPKTGLWDLFCK